MRYFSTVAFYVLAAAFLPAGSCPPSFPTDQPVYTDGEKLLADVRARTRSAKTLRALLRVDAYTSEGRFKVKEILLVERPARLHVATLSPMDSPLSVLVSNGDRFALYDQKEQKFFKGPATPKNIAKLLPVWLSGDEVVGLGFGEPPWGGCFVKGAARLFVDRDKGQYRIECPAPTARSWQRDVYGVDPRSLAVVETERLNADGSVSHRIRFSDHAKVGDLLLPRRIQYENKSKDVDILIKVVETELNEKFEAGTFELEAPRGVPTIEVK
ncbi:MAG: DUF4292 domain-containing protein [Deltaproteobacteria bacterium]|nr:DUF4292 domain-containing protein [Deltaproteobacteria bacterium]